MPTVFHVNEFVDGQKITSFNIKLLVWSFLVMFADGFDLNAIGYAAPDLARAWDIPRSEMGPVLSANLLGIFIGAPLLGWLGDRYGRRPLIIGSSLLFGVMTLLMAYSSTMTEMMVLRFIAGIGIGGIMPNTISLNSELTPKRFRSTLVILMFMGITTGSTGVGIISATYQAEYGWQLIFKLGGILPIVLSLCLLFVLPESLKLLSVLPRRRAELLHTAQLLRPDLSVPADAEFHNPPQLAAETTAPLLPNTSSWLKQSLAWLAPLFTGGLHWITPLLWICFTIALMANFFLNNTLPLIYDQYGLDQQQAAITATWYHAGGSLGGLLLSVLLDRMGFSIVALLYALAVPAVMLLGAADMGFGFLAFMAGLAGLCVPGAQFGNNAAAGLLYPTHARGKGVGMALSIGRLGAIIGPTVGAALLAFNLSMQTLFIIAALPLLIGFIAAALLSWLCYRRFNSLLLDDTPALQR